MKICKNNLFKIDILLLTDTATRAITIIGKKYVV